MPEMNLEWRNWVSENIIRGIPQQELIQILIENQFEQALAQRTVLEMLSPNQRIQVVQSDFESRLPCNGIGQPWSVVMQMENPQLTIYQNVLSAEECDHLIALSRNKLKTSTTIDNKTGKAIPHKHRTSQGSFFALKENDFIGELDERFARLMNLPVENSEGLQILNYQLEGEYRPHFDYFPSEHIGSKAHIKKGGQRVATLIIYLNDVEEGGETIFPEINLKVLPIKGGAVYFSYFHQGQVDPLTLHGGAPVLAGEKWIATKWIRESAYS